MSLLGDQIKKEVVAIKRIWNGYLTILIVFWGIIGLVMLTGQAWLLGLIFIAGAGYIFYRRKNKKKSY